MRHTIQIETFPYNSRRYGKPWVAIIDFSSSNKGDYTFGDWIGREGEPGLLRIEAPTGAILAKGQKDNRNPRPTDAQFMEVLADGSTSPISTKVNAYRRFQELGQEVSSANSVDLSGVETEALLAELSAREVATP
jgi:hypothetical protein